MFSFHVLKWITYAAKLHASQSMQANHEFDEKIVLIKRTEGLE